MAPKPFNLVLVRPHARCHGLNGYIEIIETMQWGLQDLGFSAICSLNRVKRTHTNILFGAQMMQGAEFSQVPEDTIVYNLEQMRNRDPQAVKLGLHAAAARLRVWDYSAANLDGWHAIGTRYAPLHVPIGWAPVLERIVPAQEPDIDVLFYGLPSSTRMHVLSDLCMNGLTVVHVCGLYGKARDDLIARSRVVLNLNLYEHSRIFELARVSYLLANGCCVLACNLPDTYVEPGFEDAIAWCDQADVVDQCLALAEAPEARVMLGQRGRVAMRARDIRAYLRDALVQSGFTLPEKA